MLIAMTNSTNYKEKEDEALLLLSKHISVGSQIMRSIGYWDQFVNGIKFIQIIQSKISLSPLMYVLVSVFVNCDLRFRCFRCFFQICEIASQLNGFVVGSRRREQRRRRPARSDGRCRSKVFVGRDLAADHGKLPERALQRGREEQDLVHVAATRS